MLGIWGIYLAIVSNKEAKPAYKVRSDVVLSDRQVSPKIKVYYDSIEVQNVRAVTVTIWNAGNAFIDKGAFTKDRPISILSTKPVSILDVKQVAVTRSSLQFTPTYNVDSVTGTPTDTTTTVFDYITMAIEGDDGLESGDGATFVILYTTIAKQNDWFVTARIKGVPKGFVEGYDNSNSSSLSEVLFILFIVILLNVEVQYSNKYGSLPKWFNRAFLALLVSAAVYSGYRAYMLTVTPHVPSVLSKL